jgi:hypothetical protein
MDYFLTYLILKLDDFQAFLFVAAILNTIIALIMSLAGLETRIETMKYWIFPIILGILIPINIILGILLPSTKQMALIYTLPKLKNGAVAVINDKQVQAIPDKLLKIANKQLDEWVTPLKK